MDKKVDSLLIHQYRHQTGRRQSSIRKKKAQREVLQKGIRGIREDKEEKGDKGGIKVIRRIRGDKEISVYSSILTPNRTEAEPHKKKGRHRGKCSKGG